MRFTSNQRTARLALAATAVFAYTRQSALAASRYWDTSSSTGLQAGDGTWDASTTSFWSTGSGGTALTTFGSGNDAYFQTVGTQNVTVSGTVVANSIQQSSGATTTIISGGAIQLGAGGLYSSTTGAASLTINSPITMTASESWDSLYLTPSYIVVNGPVDDGGNGYMLTKTGAGFLILSGTNTYTGGTTVSAGVLEITNALALSNGAVALSGGTLASGAAISISNNLSGSATAFGASNAGNISTSLASMTLSGSLTGSGYFQTPNNGGANTLFLSGDNSGFSGTFTAYQGAFGSRVPLRAARQRHGR